MFVFFLLDTHIDINQQNVTYEKNSDNPELTSYLGLFRGKLSELNVLSWISQAFGASL